MNEISKQIENQILNKIQADLKPNLASLIAKIFGIHMIAGAFNLGICPQLGVKLFDTNVSLMPLFMKISMKYCDALCGAFFTSMSFLLMALLLSHDEIRYIRFNKTLAVSIVLLTSVGFFWIMNPNIFLNFSFIWIGGALIGAFGSIELGTYLKRNLARAI